MYLLIGIWGSSHRVARGPVPRSVGAAPVGSREYAAMKLTLMLLVGLGGDPGGHLRLWSRPVARSFDLGAAAGVVPALDADLGLPAALAGFGTLAGVFPFHTWSPTATPRRRRRSACCTPGC